MQNSPNTETSPLCVFVPKYATHQPMCTVASIIWLYRLCEFPLLGFLVFVHQVTQKSNPAGRRKQNRNKQNPINQQQQQQPKINQDRIFKNQSWATMDTSSGRSAVYFTMSEPLYVLCTCMQV